MRSSPSHHQERGRSVKHLHLPFQLIGWPKIVIIKKRKILALCLPHSPVPRGAQTGLWLFKVTDLPCISEGLQHPARIVGRAVVDDDHFAVLIGLPKH